MATFVVPRISTQLDTPLQDLWIRPYAGDDDLPAIAAVINAANATDRVEQVLSPDDLAAALVAHDAFDPYDDVFLAGVQGTVVAGGRIDVLRELGGNRLYSTQVYVHPSWRECGLGRSLLLQAEQRLRVKAAADSSDAPRFFAATAAHTAVGGTALLALRLRACV